MTADTADAAGLAEALAAAARAAGLPAEGVADLSRLSGGASKEMWRFTLTLAGGEARALVLRRQPPGRALSAQGLGSVAREAEVLRFAAAAGVPVPEVAFGLPPGSPAGDGYAMAHVAGETIGTRVLKLPELAGARTGLARRCGAVLARLHAARGFEALGLRSEGSADALAALATRHRDTGQPRPVFDFALRWLGERLPPERDRVLLHGDFRTGNLAVGPGGLVAVLDWELAHVGPPAADLAWLCVPSWRFQHPELPVGGFGSREALFEGYVEAGGTPIDQAELFWWEAFQTLNWGVMCAGAGRAFMDGARSVEGAVIARRASETEFDLLRMLVPDHPAWSGSVAAAVRCDEPPAPLILAEVRAVLESGAASPFAQRVAANAIGVVERELAACKGPLRDAGDIGALVAATGAKLAIDQPRYPPLMLWQKQAD